MSGEERPGERPLEETDGDGGQAGLDAGRLGRILALIAFVTAVFLVTAARRLGDELFSIAVVAVGAVAFVTAIVGMLIALTSGTGWEE